MQHLLDGRCLEEDGIYFKVRQLGCTILQTTLLQDNKSPQKTKTNKIKTNLEKKHCCSRKVAEKYNLKITAAEY